MLRVKANLKDHELIETMLCLQFHAENTADSALDQSKRSVLKDMLKCLPTSDLAPSLKVFNMGYQNYSQGEWQAHCIGIRGVFDFFCC